MGFLSDSTAQTDAVSYNGIPIQTSVNTLPIPVVWGTARVGCNLIWYGDFTNNSSGGGKGSSKGKGGNTDYTASLELAICEGPIDDIFRVFKDQDAEPFSSSGFTLINGSLTQSPWSYLSTSHAANALAYRGTVLVVAENYDIGASPTVPTHSFHVDRYSGFAVSWAGSLGVFHAVDLALVIPDFLTNTQYGVQNYPSSAIDYTTLQSSSAATGAGDSAMQTYLQANGLCYNIRIDSVESGRSILERWLQLANTAAVWSGTALKFIPYGDSAVAGNGVTYLPNLTPLYDLSDDDFVIDDPENPSEDPVQIERSDPLDACNVVRVEVTTNDGQFSTVPVPAFDQSSIESPGSSERIESTIAGHELMSEYLGGIAAQLILQRGLYVRKTYQFKLGIEFCLLEPMDLVTITDLAIGLDHEVVRITGIEEDEDGTMSVTAEQFPQGIATQTQYQKQARSFNIPDGNLVPDLANQPIIFEPTALQVATPQIWAVVSGGSGGIADPNWGGCYVYVSVDGGSSYNQIGTINGVSSQGALTASLPAIAPTDPNPDTVHTLSVSMALSGIPLDTGSDTKADLDITLCYVDGEMIAYGNAAMASGGAYNITYLQRGLYGTSPSVHASGSQFARLTDQIFKYDLPRNLVGKTLYLKFLGFNIFGAGVQDISTVTAYAYTPTGIAFTGAAVTIAPSSGDTVNFPAQAESLLIYPSGTLSSLTIVLPKYPADSQQAVIFANKAITALTIQANTGQSIMNQPASLAANSGCTMSYTASNSTWTRSA